MSRIDQFMNKVKGGESGEHEKEAENEQQNKKNEEDAVKEEGRLTKVLEASRNYFIAEKLSGNVTVFYSFLIFGNSISCDIDGSSEMSEDSSNETNQKVDKEEVEKLDRFQTTVVNSTKKAIKNMENRALAYKDKPYRGDLQLSSSVSVTTPGLSLASFSITCTATLASLLARKERIAANSKNGK
jgi:hypothetical protein